MSSQWLLCFFIACFAHLTVDSRYIGQRNYYPGYVPSLPFASSYPFYTPSIYTPPSPYFNQRSQFPGGGIPIIVDYKKRCSGNYLGLKSHPRDLEHYYICRSDSVIFGKCFPYQTFDESRGQCVTSPQFYTVCPTTGRFSIPSDCRLYYKCEDTQPPILYTCPDNMVFSDDRQICISDGKSRTTLVDTDNSFVSIDSEYKLPSCTEAGVFRSTYDCSIYYNCTVQADGSFLQTQYKCADDYSFDTTQNTCLPSSEVSCDYIQIAKLVYPQQPVQSYQTQYYPQYSTGFTENKEYPVEESMNPQPTNIQHAEIANRQENIDFASNVLIQSGSTTDSSSTSTDSSTNDPTEDTSTESSTSLDDSTTIEFTSTESSSTDSTSSDSTSTSTTDSSSTDPDTTSTDVTSTESTSTDADSTSTESSSTDSTSTTSDPSLTDSTLDSTSTQSTSTESSSTDIVSTTSSTTDSTSTDQTTSTGSSSTDTDTSTTEMTSSSTESSSTDTDTSTTEMTSTSTESTTPNSSSTDSTDTTSTEMTSSSTESSTSDSSSTESTTPDSSSTDFTDTTSTEMTSSSTESSTSDSSSTESTTPESSSTDSTTVDSSFSALAADSNDSDTVGANEINPNQDTKHKTHTTLHKSSLHTTNLHNSNNFQHDFLRESRSAHELLQGNKIIDKSEFSNGLLECEDTNDILESEEFGSEEKPDLSTETNLSDNIILSSVEEDKNANVISDEITKEKQKDIKFIINFTSTAKPISESSTLTDKITTLSTEMPLIWKINSKQEPTDKSDYVTTETTPTMPITNNKSQSTTRRPTNTDLSSEEYFEYEIVDESDSTTTENTPTTIPNIESKSTFPDATSTLTSKLTTPKITTDNLSSEEYFEYEIVDEFDSTTTENIPTTPTSNQKIKSTFSDLTLTPSPHQTAIVVSEEKFKRNVNDLERSSKDSNPTSSRSDPTQTKIPATGIITTLSDKESKNKETDLNDVFVNKFDKFPKNSKTVDFENKVEPKKEIKNTILTLNEINTNDTHSPHRILIRTSDTNIKNLTVNEDKPVKIKDLTIISEPCGQIDSPIAKLNLVFKGPLAMNIHYDSSPCDGNYDSGANSNVLDINLQSNSTSNGELDLEISK